MVASFIVFSIFGLGGLGCTDDPIPEPEPVEGCAFGGSPDSASGGDGEIDGIYYACSGTRSAEFDAKVCANDSCSFGAPLEEHTILFTFGPYHESADLEFEDQFFSDFVFDPPDTGACCIEGASPSAVLEVSEIDCAAKACLRAQTQMLFLSTKALVGVAETEGGPGEVSAQHLQKSLDFHYTSLNDPAVFSDCTNGLYATGVFSTPLYAPSNGVAGAVETIVVQNFKCPLSEIDCSLATVPSTGEIVSCINNPSWIPENAGASIAGAVEAEEGTVSIMPDDQKSSLKNGLIEYRRYECAGDVCPFVLTMMEFANADNLTVGPFVFHSPTIRLEHESVGTLDGSSIRFQQGSLILSVESSVSIGGAVLFNGAILPLSVSNLDLSKMSFEGDVFSITEARFGLPFGSWGELSLAPSKCSEDE